MTEPNHTGLACLLCTSFINTSTLYYT